MSTFQNSLPAISSLLLLLSAGSGLNFQAPTASLAPSLQQSCFITLEKECPMFKSKIFKVAYAITIAEGWYFDKSQNANFLGSISYRNHNPGNLRSSVYQVGTETGFAVFENDAVGFYAIVHQLWLYASDNSKVANSNETIERVIAKYNSLPVNTPDFNNYISIVEKVGEVSRNDPISTLIE